MRPLRILQVTTVANEVSGIWTVMRTLSTALAATGAAVSVAHPAGAGARLDEPGLMEHPLPEPLWSMAGVRALWRLLREARPDVVHCHTRQALAAAMVASAPLRPRPTWVFTGHNTHDLNASCYTCLGADRCVFVSQAAQSAHLAVLPAALAARLRSRSVVIPNGVPPPRTLVPRASARGQLGLTPPAVSKGTVVLGFVGGGGVRKGLDVLLQALAALPARVHLAVIGGVYGEDRSLAERLIGHGHLEARVHLMGPRSGAAALVPAFDLLVVPSRADAFPTVVLEAFAAGVPVVASAVDGLAELIIPGRTGWLCPAEDPASLAATVQAALSVPPGVRAEVVERARRCCQQQFSAVAMAEGYLAVYREGGAAVSRGVGLGRHLGVR